MGRQALICVALCICATLGPALPASAAARPRTPAEIEARRLEIALRLVELADEDARLAANGAQLAVQLTEALDQDTRAALEDAVAQVGYRRGELADERAALEAEARPLEAIVTRNATGPLSTLDPVGLAGAQPPPAGTEQVGAGNAFNPAITIIPDGLYTNDTRRGRVGELLRTVDGFRATGAGLDVADSPRGFSLREVELAFSGAVDPYFDAWATFGIADGEIEAEEVFVQTRRLLPGLQVRAGRFFSGIGYLNRQHTHQWAFVDQALPYEALFGGRLEETGVQVTWLPALPVYLQLGFEALQGENPLIANQLAESNADRLEQTAGPRLFTGFVKLAPELGYDHTLQVGASFGRSRSHQETAVAPSEPVGELFEGTAWFLGAEGIWRYDSGRQYGERDVTLVGEYFYRVKDLDGTTSAMPPAMRVSRQDGIYVQAVYGIAPRWTVGGRADAIGRRNRLETPLGRAESPSSSRVALDVTFDPTEFSRLRVQYNHGRIWSGQRETYHQMYVQFQMSLGVHGAHRF
jgi:hypothetical protein